MDMGKTARQIQVDELLKISAFRVLSEEQLIVIAQAMTRMCYDPGEMIFLEGDASEVLWFVAEGRVKILKQSLHGRTQGLCLLDSGKCFGSCPIFDMDTNPATAQALDKVTLFLLPRDLLKGFTQRDPQLTAALLAIFSQRLGHLARVSEVLGAWTVHDRINDCLVTYMKHEESHPVVKLTHEELADLTGTVREVVTRHLSKLEKAGTIRIAPRRITVLDAEALIPACGCEN